jgi:uncharacterized membrane protein
MGIFIEILLPIFPSLSYFFPFINLTYSHVCHQHPEKLISFEFGHSLTCARCTGIYFGTFVSSVLLLFLKVKQNISHKLFLIAIVLILIDIIMYSTGVYNYSKIIALLTGMFFGSIVFYYFYKGLNEFFTDKN